MISKGRPLFWCLCSVESEHTKQLAAAVKSVGAVMHLVTKPPAANRESLSLAARSVAALVDLDLGSIAQQWLPALRAAVPRLPVVAIIENAEFEDLKSTATSGINYAITLPGDQRGLADELRRWIPETTATSSPPQSTEKHLRAPARPTIHLAAASPGSALVAAQIQSLDNQVWWLQAPPGSESTLVAAEILSERIAQQASRNDVSPAAHPHVHLITTLPCATDPQPSSGNDILYAIPGTACPTHFRAEVLELPPLSTRPADIIIYTQRLFPLLRRAARSQPILGPLPIGWRQSLLNYRWPGEYTELRQTLGRLALLDPTDPPQGFRSKRITDPVAELEANLVAEFHDRVAARVPPDRLEKVLSALGCKS